eukprot:c9480_g1_i2.p1 GENE.c9480_g1_i2~~c9480_g1_i2.p1  ORF type:complete len:379 (+),score=86.00 c9480_g1_i2:1-1137(+)
MGNSRRHSIDQRPFFWQMAGGGPIGQFGKTNHARSVALLLLFWIGNVGLNVYNKWLFAKGGFRVPLFVTISHQIFCFLGAALMLLTPFYKRKKIEDTSVLLKLLTVSVFFSLNTGLNNTSLLYLTLSANQIIRALLPAICAVFATFIEGKKYNNWQWATMFILVIGVILALLDNPSFDELGTALCLSSVVGAALHVSVVGYFLGQMNMTAFDMLLYTTIPIALILLPPFLLSNEIEKLEKFEEKEGMVRAVFLVAVGGVIAFLYNLVHYFFIHYTSSVYTTVAGNMKVALVVCFSFVFLDDEATVLNIVGLSIACLAFFANSYLEFQTKEAAKKTPRVSRDDDDRPDTIREQDRAVLEKYDKLIAESDHLLSRSKVVS